MLVIQIWISHCAETNRKKKKKIRLLKAHSSPNWSWERLRISDPTHTMSHLPQLQDGKGHYFLHVHTDDKWQKKKFCRFSEILHKLPHFHPNVFLGVGRPPFLFDFLECIATACWRLETRVEIYQTNKDTVRVHIHTDTHVGCIGIPC